MNSLFTQSVSNINGDGLHLVKRCAVPVIVLTSSLAIGISVLCLSIGYSIIFPHLYYLPIIFACTNFPRKGFFFTSCLSLLYLFLVLFITHDTVLLGQALVRIICFEAVGFVIAWLSIKRLNAEKALTQQRDKLSTIVRNQNECIKNELQQCHRLESAYRDSYEFYECLMDQNKVPIIVWNSSLYITKTNPAFEQLVGRPRDELLGRKIFAVLPVEEVVRKGYSVTVVLPVQGNDGGVHQMIWTISTIYTDNPADPSAAIAIGQEIPRVRYRSKIGAAALQVKEHSV